jgi:hypothetical protein
MHFWKMICDRPTYFPVAVSGVRESFPNLEKGTLMKLETLDHILKFMNAHIEAAALNAALELGFFWEQKNSHPKLVVIMGEKHI